MSDNNMISSTVSPEIYQDEPIPPSSSRRLNVTPAKYYEMRKIAYNSYGTLPDSVVFYRQGKFMADFEDDFNYSGNFSSYCAPTYNTMSLPQLRGYFSWRTKIRHGEYEFAPLGFAQIYIYELINQIGVTSLADGFEKLKNFYLNYKDINPQIDGFGRLYLKDYVIYYGLEQTLLNGIALTDKPAHIQILMHFTQYPANDVFAALNYITRGQLSKSRVYQQNPELYTQITAGTYAAIWSYLAEKKPDNPAGVLFGERRRNLYDIFAAAVFYEPVICPNAVYDFPDGRQYCCTNGAWSYNFYLLNKRNLHTLSNIFKLQESLLRERLELKPRLKSPENSAEYRQLLLTVIEKYLPAPPPPPPTAATEIKLDLSKLDSIRQTAQITQNKLLVEEENVVEPPPTPAVCLPPPLPVAPENYGLTEIERQFLIKLLKHEPYGDFLNSAHLMPSLLADGINEKLFDRFNDTVLVFNGDNPEILDDYLDELKGMFDL